MRWRLLLDGPGDGAWNMAIDEALFHSAVEGLAPPTVRLYDWSQPTLSIGFRQKLARTCNLRACRQVGVDTVRRFTGGRAVLHDRELTYCVAARAEGPFRGLSVRQVYLWVSNVLRRALQSNGIPIDPPPFPGTSPESTRDDTAPCFAVPTRHEITSGGRKLVGGAQKWSRRGFAQHGSMLMEIDRDLWSKVWGPDAATTMEAVGLQELSGTRRTRSELTELLAREFERALGEPPSQAGLLPSELRMAEALAEQRYGSPQWNSRRRTASVR